jgi:hypothetical protein
MSDEVVRLATQLAPSDQPSIIHLGIVTDVDSGPPVLVTVDDKPMRCYFAYTSPQVGDVINYLEDQNVRLALGPRL